MQSGEDLEVCREGRARTGSPLPSPDDLAWYTSSLGVFVCTLYHILSQSGQRVSSSSVSCASQSVAPEQGVIGVVGTSDLMTQPVSQKHRWQPRLDLGV